MRWLTWTFIALLLTTPAAASDARLQAMAVQTEYLEDYILVRLYPTVAARYGNLLVGSVGARNVGDYSVGILAGGKSGNYGRFGVFLNRQHDDSNNAQVDMVWSKQFRTVALGLGAAVTTSEIRTGETVVSPGSYPRDLNQTSLTAGINADLSTSTSLEGALELAWLYWERTGVPALPDTKSEGKPSYRASVRMKAVVSSQTTLVPLLQFSHVDLTAENDPGDSFSRSGNLGLALHQRVNGRDLIVGGVALNYWKRQSAQDGQITELTRWDLPALFLALEFNAAGWLTGRVGATKTLDVASGSDHSETLTSRYFFGIGLGVHAKNFDIDAAINPDAVFSGGYLVSGQRTEFLNRVTVTYYF